MPSIRPGPAELSLEGVTLVYPGRAAPALEGVTLRVPAGTSLGVAGRTGAGKSTLLTAVLRLTPLAAGRVAVNGVDLAHVTTQCAAAALAASLVAVVDPCCNSDCVITKTRDRNMRMPLPSPSPPQSILMALCCSFNKCS
jgi:energy-coupling factor transporter ATP-binding protein EcfA2